MGAFMAERLRRVITPPTGRIGRSFATFLGIPRTPAHEYRRLIREVHSKADLPGLDGISVAAFGQTTVCPPAGRRAIGTVEHYKLRLMEVNLVRLAVCPTKEVLI